MNIVKGVFIASNVQEEHDNSDQKLYRNKEKYVNLKFFSRKKILIPTEVSGYMLMYKILIAHSHYHQNHWICINWKSCIIYNCKIKWGQHLDERVFCVDFFKNINAHLISHIKKQCSERPIIGSQLLKNLCII